VLCRIVLSNLSFGAICLAGQLTGSETKTWTGTLYDTARTECSTETAHSSAPGTCPVSICTRQFGIRLPDGKLYKFDEGGNSKVADALRKSKKGSKTVVDYWKSGKVAKPVAARATGSLTSDTFNLENITVE
jgi:hypothetical protein